MGTKFSQFTDAATALATDQLVGVRGATDIRMSLTELRAFLGPLMVVAHTSTNHTYTASTQTTIDFDAVDYDPLSTITTGGSWKFTAPVTGYYQVSVEEGFFEANSADWIAGDIPEIYLYKNASTYWQTIDSEPFGVAVLSTDLSYVVLHGTATVQLNATETCRVEIQNTAGANRILDSKTQLIITRIA